MTAPVIAARRGLVAISGAGLLWGTTGVVLELVRRSSELSPVGVGFYRLAIAAIVLLLITAKRLSPAMSAIRSQPWRIVLIGIGVGAFHALYFVSVAGGGVAVATVVCLGVPPVAIAGWEALRFRRMPTGAALWGVTSAVAGLALISGLGTLPSGTAPRPILGLVTAGAGGLSFATTTLLSRRTMQTMDPLLLTTASSAVGAVTLLPVALLTGGIALPTRLPATGMLVYLGVVATALAYALFYRGLSTTAGSTAVVLTLVEPVAATALSVVVLGEHLSIPAIAGGALLLGAVVLTHLFPASERPSLDRLAPVSGPTLP